MTIKKLISVLACVAMVSASGCDAVSSSSATSVASTGTSSTSSDPIPETEYAISWPTLTDAELDYDVTSAVADATVNFTVTITNPVMAIESAKANDVALTGTGDGAVIDFSFTMPARDVSVSVSLYDTTLFNIYVAANPEEVVITGLPNKANTGDFVSFTVGLFDGVGLESLVLADVSGTPINMTLELNKYSFTMPDHDVYLTATTNTPEVLITAIIDAAASNLEVMPLDDSEEDSVATVSPSKYYVGLPGDTVKMKVNYSNASYKLLSVAFNGDLLTVEDNIFTFVIGNDPGWLVIEKQFAYHAINIDTSVGTHLTLTAKVGDDVVTEAYAGQTVSVSVSTIEDAKFAYDSITVVKTATPEDVIKKQNYPASMPFTFTMTAEPVTVSATERATDIVDSDFVGYYKGVQFAYVGTGDSSTSTVSTALSAYQLDIRTDGYYTFGTTIPDSGAKKFTIENDVLIGAGNQKIIMLDNNFVLVYNNTSNGVEYSKVYIYLLKRDAQTVPTASSDNKAVFNLSSSTWSASRLNFSLCSYVFDGETINILIKDEVVYFDVKIDMISGNNFWTNGATFKISDKTTDETIIYAKYTSNNRSTSSLSILPAGAEQGTYEHSSATGASDIVLDGYGVATYDGNNYTYSMFTTTLVNINDRYYVLDLENMEYTEKPTYAGKSFLGSFFGMEAYSTSGDKFNVTLGEDGFMASTIKGAGTFSYTDDESTNTITAVNSSNNKFSINYSEVSTTGYAYGYYSSSSSFTNTVVYKKGATSATTPTVLYQTGAANGVSRGGRSITNFKFVTPETSDPSDCWAFMYDGYFFIDVTIVPISVTGTKKFYEAASVFEIYRNSSDASSETNIIAKLEYSGASGNSNTFTIVSYGLLPNPTTA